MNTAITSCLAIVMTLALAACGDESPQTQPVSATGGGTMSRPAIPPLHPNPAKGEVFVHLFEWRWPDVATECETFLGPNGYAAVQVSPAQEHIPGDQWWTRYQPVSYRIVSRGGTRAEFADMVRRCRAAGVDVYADAVINHMAAIGEGHGVAGSAYGIFNYPVPYDYDDFHHCGRNSHNNIANYQDLWEVQNCNLGTLPDLDTGSPSVQAKIAAYLEDLLSLGVGGFRIDAAKHMPSADITSILGLLDTRPFIYQEVIDWGTEAIDASDYLVNGDVTEFKYPKALFAAFAGGALDTLQNLGQGAGYLPPDKAVVFVDNHDLQRGHAGGENILNYKYGELYDLANVFMLAWPYGYPMVMSGYYFEDSDQGPPAIEPVERGACTSGWVCEHRRPAMTGMAGFRKATMGLPVTNWQAMGGKLIAFGRGDRGFIVINTGDETFDGEFETGMPGGDYCNIVVTGGVEKGCPGAGIRVDDNGLLKISLPAMGAVAILSPAP